MAWVCTWSQQQRVWYLPAPSYSPRARRKKKTLRRLTAVMLRTFPKMVDVAGVFFTALIVYSVLGAQLFNNQHVPPGPYGYQANNDNYNNVGHAALATYIFTTTEVRAAGATTTTTTAPTCSLVPWWA